MGTQRASALPFGATRSPALLAILVVFRLPFPKGSATATYEPTWRPLLGIDPALMTPDGMTHELRRLAGIGPLPSWVGQIGPVDRSRLGAHADEGPPDRGLTAPDSSATPHELPYVADRTPAPVRVYRG